MSCPFCFWHKKPKKNPLKVVLIVIGAVVASAGALVALYHFVFKKFFNVTIECEDCDKCNGDDEGVEVEDEEGDADADEEETEEEAEEEASEDENK